MVATHIHRKEETFELAKELYENVIKHQLTDDQLGMYLAIDVNSGDYELGTDGSKDSRSTLRERCPNGRLFPDASRLLHHRFNRLRTTYARIMVTGRVVGNETVLKPSVELIVYGRSSVRARVRAVVDTGFNGFLTMPIRAVQDLDLQFVIEEELSMANGVTVKFKVFSAVVDWGGSMRRVRVHSAEGDPLIGMEMLRDHDLHIRAIPNGNISIQSVV